jgi:small subunit ribosomal protein S4
VKCNIASRRVNPGDEITLGTKAQEMALVMEAQGLSERDIPDYVSPRWRRQGHLRPRAPRSTRCPYPVKMEPNLVVEFYSR